MLQRLGLPKKPIPIRSTIDTSETMANVLCSRNAHPMPAATAPRIPIHTMQLSIGSFRLRIAPPQ